MEAITSGAINRSNIYSCYAVLSAPYSSRARYGPRNMRSLGISLALALLLASPAVAAPTCENPRGETVRCGTAGAMPVGWVLSPRDRQQLRPELSDEPAPIKLLQTLCVLGVFFSVLALMPDFDGSRSEDWDSQEEETHRRR
jgi:hypothetical protein